MTAKLVISAIADVTYARGDVIGLVPEGEDYGGSEVPPNFVRATITNVTNTEAQAYLFNWEIDFIFTLVNQNALGWRYRVEVDPIYISASGVGQAELKTEMQTYIETTEEWEGASIVSFTTTSMTVDIPKNGVYQTANGLTDNEYLKLLRDHFSDVFKQILNIRRYYFNAAFVDAALLLTDGEWTGLKSEALASLVDRLDE